jgi:HK97 family phage prohead protease
MDKQPPTNQIERRVVAGEIRAKKTEGGPTVLSGYAAVFNRETVIDGWFPFREVILPGCFAEAIKTDDVRFLFNHNADVVLGRTTNGTLRLSEDSIGLHYENDLNPNDPDAVSVGAKVERGDVSQSSFAFRVDEDEWDESEVKAGKLPLRKIVRVAPLFDASCVTYPAYEATTVSARAEQRAKELTAPPPPTVVDAPVVVPVVEASRTFWADPDSRIREWELRKRERHAA